MSNNQKGKRKAISVSNAVKLDANTPIPFDYSGNAFTSPSSTSYLPFIGENDNFSKILLEARLLSVTQNACITTKKNYTVGEGLYFPNLKENEKPDKDFEDWIKSINNKGEHVNTLFSKGIGSYLSFGNAVFEVVRGTAGGKKFLKVYASNFLECRLSNPNDDDVCEYIIKSKSFKDGGVSYVTNSVPIPIYNTLKKNKSWVKDGAVERTIIFLKNDYEGYDYYGMPSSVSCLPQQVAEYEMVRYNLDNFENNMNPGGVIVLQGNITQPEANRLGKEIIKQHTGKGKRGRWVVLCSEDGIQDSKINPFNTQQDGSYLEADKNVMNKIIFANEWDALLAGLDNSGGLGKGNSFLLSLFKQKYQSVIAPLQKKFIDEFFKKVVAIADEWLGKKWSDYEFGLLTNTPISVLESDKTLDVWTVDEIRKEAGLPLFNNNIGKQLYGEIKNKNVQGQPA